MISLLSVLTFHSKENSGGICSPDRMDVATRRHLLSKRHAPLWQLFEENGGAEEFNFLAAFDIESLNKKMLKEGVEANPASEEDEDSSFSFQVLEPNSISWSNTSSNPTSRNNGSLLTDEKSDTVDANLPKRNLSGATENKPVLPKWYAWLWWCECVLQTH
eukprot:c53554_g1_i1 orf=3-482(-)